MALERGQRVKFRRQHDKSLELTGQIQGINDDGTVQIETEPDGKILEVSTVETAHADDVTPIAEETLSQETRATDGIPGIEEEPASETGAESRPRRRR